MAEEQKWQEPGGHRLCANNCGFFGSPTTLNLCSKCYKDHCLKEQHMSKAKIAVEKTFSQPPDSESTSSFASSSSSNLLVRPEEAPVSGNTAEAAPSPPPPPPQGGTRGNRCGTCRRRVGLTGFKCKCGPMFCGTHRYPEQHGCSIDFKALGKEEIAKSNPVVKAEKLNKI